ncbi:MAG TPA: xanthine dehydrogenase family protein molybdopterin-binding subunit [Bacillota bacterium]|nr:xanthine dehydrogenase family protein molybdopterin-binding subunit [Bacillota bacterium]HOC06967.1 xanthine dehydrogenase family protein molybdopterin-binding subunit [Bacillota bacterium]HPZ22599.1 xanthine dehydrogenase family protein molybdopterin-binding subunit [Bacillota bacterium]HQD20362.1 xanthine dehydrogenase family protein molybdopterin-binding subunit [Bacillota bacterium]
MKGYVGKRINRVDALDKVLGKPLYATDLHMEGMLYLKVLHAPHPHALIKKIDVSKARELPGVVKVITAADVPWLKTYGLIFKDQEVLVKEKTRYLGDRLAVVAAEDEKSARQALRLIEVEYEPLEVISDPLRAMEPDAPKIHESGQVQFEHPYNKGNVLAIDHLVKGDVEAGFAEADYIFENEFRTQHVDHVAMELEAGMAVYDPDTDCYTLWAPCQWLHDIQTDVARTLGIRMEQLKIIQPSAIGGAFGRREDISVHIILPLMAKLTGRPVKWAMTREESMIIMTKRTPFIFRLKTGVKKDGTITAWQSEVIGDSGAYASTAGSIVHQAMYVSTGPYDVPNVKGISYTVYTNNTYTGAMRGFGATEAAFAYERQMDCIARDMGWDPAEFRLKNAFRIGSCTANGQILTTSVGTVDTILTAREHFGSKGVASAPHKKRGMGMATIMFGCGYGEGFPDHSIAGAKVTDEGRILITSAAADVGQGVKTIMVQIAANVLNIPPECIDLAQSDTATTKNAGSTSATRQTIFSGNAVKIAAENLLGKIFHRANVELGRAYPELSVVDGDIILHGTTRQMSLGELAKIAREKGEPLEAEGCYFPRTDIDYSTGQGDVVYVTYTFNTQFIEVEVDTETGEVDVLRIVAAPDVGLAINPASVEGQSEGGAAMGLGMALMEEQVFKEGVTVNPDLATYLIPTSLDVPDVKTIIVESGDACGPFGAKGIGEPAMIPTAPAILNAIEDAVGIRLYDMPATPEKVLAAIKAKDREVKHE